MGSINNFRTNPLYSLQKNIIDKLTYIKTTARSTTVKISLKDLERSKISRDETFRRNEGLPKLLY